MKIQQQMIFCNVVMAVQRAWKRGGAYIEKKM